MLQRPGEILPGAGDTPAQPSFSLVEALLESDALLDVVRLMPAAAAARLAKASTATHARLLEPQVARWCAASRRALLEARNVRGDLSLAPTDCAWSLERLHLCEYPPRFPRIYFQFASDELESGSLAAVARVAVLLKRHPTLRLRIHGFAQPAAPDAIGEALAQARATRVRRALLTLLRDCPAFAAEASIEDGVRRDARVSPWSLTLSDLHRHTRLVGDKVQAVGRWGCWPANHNFEAGEGEEEGAGEEETVGAVGGGVEDGQGEEGGGSPSGDEDEEEEEWEEEEEFIEEEEDDDEEDEEDEEGGAAAGTAVALSGTVGDLLQARLILTLTPTHQTLGAVSELLQSMNEESDGDSDSDSEASHRSIDYMRMAEFTLLGLAQV